MLKSTSLSLKLFLGLQMSSTCRPLHPGQPLALIAPMKLVQRGLLSKTAMHAIYFVGPFILARVGSSATAALKPPGKQD